MLKVVSIEEKEDRSGNKYRLIEFIDLNNFKSAKRIFYEDSSAAAFLLSVNDTPEGQIVTEEVIPYSIGNLVRKTYTSVILGSYKSEEQFRSEIKRVFAKLGKPLKDINIGKPDRPVFAF